MNGPKAKWGILLGIITGVLALDQWTKHLIHSRFRYGESLPIIDNFFAITYVRNKGAAFGFLDQAPDWFREPFFLSMPVIALGVILFIYYRLSNQKWLTAVALSLIVSGAIGNLIDRVMFGYVIDFLDFHWKHVWTYPAFNVADSCIVVGVGLMLIHSFQQGKVCVSDVRKDGNVGETPKGSRSLE